MTISIGDYVIMNDADKPCTRLIAQVIELPEGQDFVRARYICERTNMREPYGRLSGATLVSDFGVEMTFDGDTVTTEQVRPSVATYRDGRPRDWQPHGENPTQALFKEKRKKAKRKRDKFDAIVEVLGFDAKVHYRRAANDPDVLEALSTPGYAVRGDAVAWAVIQKAIIETNQPFDVPLKFRMGRFLAGPVYVSPENQMDFWMRLGAANGNILVV